jgi:S1-C subfamily serine protease
VLAVDGEPVSGVDDLHRMLDGDHIGRPCTLAIAREGAERELLLTPRELATR